MTNANLAPIPPSPTNSHLLLNVITVRLDQIEIVPDRDRRGESVSVADLVESLPTIGQLHPLLVLPEQNGKHELLAGHRRLRAARELGWTEVRVQVITLDDLRTELATIDENLARKNLPPSERARQQARAKEIYERLHPETKHGGNRRKGSSGHGGNLKKPKSFVKATAEATGRSTRAISRDIKLAESGAPVLLAAVDAGKVKLTDAERVARLPADQQEAEVAKITARNAQNKTDETSLKKVVVARVIDQPVRGDEKLTVKARVIDQPAKGDEKLTVKATIIDLNGQTRSDKQPTPISESSMIQPAQSPVALGELLVTAAVQFQASIKGGEIGEPERVLELVRRVRDILSAVTNAVLLMRSIKPAAST
jgi:ParB-like chromosome segregation protein Spo0J